MFQLFFGSSEKYHLITTSRSVIFWGFYKFVIVQRNMTLFFVSMSCLGSCRPVKLTPRRFIFQLLQTSIVIKSGGVMKKTGTVFDMCA